MSNYPDKESAEKAAKDKEKEYGEPFIVHQDTSDPRFWWATRKSAIR